MRGSLVQRYKSSWSIVLDLGYEVDHVNYLFYEHSPGVHDTGLRQVVRQRIGIGGDDRAGRNQMR